MKKTEYYPRAKERDGMKKLHFYKNRKLDSQKDKYKNLTSNHYYGFDPKSLSIHMNPESARAKESNKLIQIEKGRMKTEEINHSRIRWTQDLSLRSVFSSTKKKIFGNEREAMLPLSIL